MKKSIGRHVILKFLVSCLMLTLCLVGTGNIAYAQEIELLKEQEAVIIKERDFEQKIYSRAIVGDNFDDSSLLVIMDKKISEPNKEYEKSFFDNVEMSHVEDLTKFDGDVKTINGNKVNMKNDQTSTKYNDENENIITATEDGFEQILKISIPKRGKENVLKAIGQLEKIEGIKYAGPNYLYSLMTTNLGLQDENWGLYDADYGINAPGAWGITKGADVNVGIIDSGINSNNEFGNRLVTGKEFLNNTTNTTDAIGHGTAVAGIVGGTTYGIAPKVSLVPLKVGSKDDGLEEGAQVISAINYAQRNDIYILNFSGGWSENPSPAEAPWHYYDPALYETIKNYPGLFVCSAGNSGRNNDASAPVYPASYDLPNLISVGAIDKKGNIAYKSNYGAKTVDIFAPTNVPTIKYDEFSGTSASAPFVTGVAALIKSKYPKAPPEKIKAAIMSGVDKISGFDEYCVSGGTLDAYKALKYMQDWTWTSNTNSFGTITSSGNIAGREPYGAFDSYIGSVPASEYPAGQWTSNYTSGWIELKLNSYVKVSKLYFYNRESGASDYTKNAFFTGSGGIPLGESFVGVKKDYGFTEIPVNNIVTNIIRLNILSSYGPDYVGANEIIVTATPASTPSQTIWNQPKWTSNSNGDGVITASGTYGNEAPWKAFNGTMTGGSAPNCDDWGAQGTSGWLEIRFASPIMIHMIEFYNGVSGSSNRTKNANFINKDGVPLGNPFTAPNRDYGYVPIRVGGIITNVVRLNISSSYGSYVSAGNIVIYATIPVDMPFNYWQQPVWTSNSNSYGTITASGTYGNEYPWKAFNGTRIGGTAPNCDNWSVKATTGWIELKLEDHVRISSIEVWNCVSGSSNRTKGAYLTGSDNVALGSSFVLSNSDYSYMKVNVNNVWTDVIRLNITSSYGTYVGVGMIKITAIN